MNIHYISQNIFYIVINLAFLLYAVSIITEIKQSKVLLGISSFLCVPYVLMTLEYFILTDLKQYSILIYIVGPVLFITYLMYNKSANMFLLALPAFYLVGLAGNELNDLGYTKIIYTASAVAIGLGVYNYFRDSSDEGKVSIVVTTVLLRYFLIYAHSMTL